MDNGVKRKVHNAPVEKSAKWTDFFTHWPRELMCHKLMQQLIRIDFTIFAIQIYSIFKKKPQWIQELYG